MKITFKASYEEITRSVSARGVGVFLGALIAGLFVDLLGPKKDWLVFVSQTMFVVAIFVMPFAGSLGALWVLFFALGAAGGMANVGEYSYRCFAVVFFFLLFFGYINHCMQAESSPSCVIF